MLKYLFFHGSRLTLNNFEKKYHVGNTRSSQGFGPTNNWSIIWVWFPSHILGAQISGYGILTSYSVAKIGLHDAGDDSERNLRICSSIEVGEKVTITSWPEYAMIIEIFFPISFIIFYNMSAFISVIDVNTQLFPCLFSKLYHYYLSIYVVCD